MPQAYPLDSSSPITTFDYSDPVVDAPLFTSEDQAANSAYSQYPIDTNYTWDEGLHVMPVAGPPGTPARVMRLHAGLALKRIHWSAERVGEQPECPHWDLGNSNEILMSKVIVPASPTTLPYGISQAWKVSGVYTYVIQTPPGDTALLYAGAPPTDTPTSMENTINLANFSMDIINAPGE